MNLPVFTALKNKMQWHQARQGVLSNNIAHASTPNYQAKDLAPLSDPLKAPVRSQSFSTFLTDRKHITGSIAPPSGFNGVGTSDSFEITPDENSVVLEEQMMKLSGNQMDYQAATSLYTSNLGLLRTAMGASNRG